MFSVLSGRQLGIQSLVKKIRLRNGPGINGFTVSFEKCEQSVGFLPINPKRKLPLIRDREGSTENKRSENGENVSAEAAIQKVEVSPETHR